MEGSGIRLQSGAPPPAFNYGGSAHSNRTKDAVAQREQHLNTLKEIQKQQNNAHPDGGLPLEPPATPIDDGHNPFSSPPPNRKGQPHETKPMPLSPMPNQKCPPHTTLQSPTTDGQPHAAPVPDFLGASLPQSDNRNLKDQLGASLPCPGPGDMPPVGISQEEPMRSLPPVDRLSMSSPLPIVGDHHLQRQVDRQNTSSPHPFTNDRPPASPRLLRGDRHGTSPKPPGSPLLIRSSHSNPFLEDDRYPGSPKLVREIHSEGARPGSPVIAQQSSSGSHNIHSGPTPMSPKLQRGKSDPMPQHVHQEPLASPKSKHDKKHGKSVLKHVKDEQPPGSPKQKHGKQKGRTVSDQPHEDGTRSPQPTHGILYSPPPLSPVQKEALGPNTSVSSTQPVCEDPPTSPTTLAFSYQQVPQVVDFDTWRKEHSFPNIPEPDYQKDDEGTNGEQDSTSPTTSKPQGLIEPKKLRNPNLESREKLDLHKELLYNSKMGIDILNQKSEFKRELEKRREKQHVRDKEEYLRSKRTSLDLQLQKQANKIKELEEHHDEAEDDSKKPEFFKIHARIRSTKVQSTEANS
ncbi:uncharacterized protein LOC135490662 isoform X2 [Lineus longissimus]|uniref:uncharacterized protein LOC135490662 isoform X2 n=1 Tax=Lineus longissimus TaxID=88925 RepID=UPI00315CB30B